MPASRPYWKGYLKLSFVSCQVALYPATSAPERVSFRQVNRRTGHRLKHKLVDSVTGERRHCPAAENAPAAAAEPRRSGVVGNEARNASSAELVPGIRVE